MLIQFNFENHKSYKDEASLNMMASGIKEHPGNLITGKKDAKYLKVAAIYGSNASGKSNVFSAFANMIRIINNSFSDLSKWETIPIDTFNFSRTGRDGSAMFEIFFVHNENEYQYGFKASKYEILEEWLYKRDYRGKSRYNTLFERKRREMNLSKKLESFRDVLSNLNEKTLILSFLQNTKLEEIANIKDWLDNVRIINYGNIEYERLIARRVPFKKSNETNYKQFMDFLGAVDVGIKDIVLEKHEDDIKKYRVFTVHDNIDSEDDVHMNLGSESSGTLKVISMYRDIAGALENGGVIFVDEMDAKLHPLITRFIVNLFQGNGNEKNTQLIFTTHDINILTKDVFRRDQVWFAEKNSSGVSELYSLVEYKYDSKKIRNDASYNKDYLSGKYGALPYIGEFMVGEKKSGKR